MFFRKCEKSPNSPVKITIAIKIKTGKSVFIFIAIVMHYPPPFIPV